MPLIEVPGGWLDPQRPQRSHATDSQHELLAEAHLATPYIQDVGDRPVGTVVGGDVGIEQQQRHTSDVGDPDGCLHAVARVVHGDLQRRSVPAPRAAQREHVRVEERLGMLLVAVGVDLLAEVAAAVEEPDGHERERRV